MAKDNYDLTTVKGRLLALLKKKRMSQTEFTKLLGVSSTYIGAMRRSIPHDKVRMIMQIFPDLNRNWLLYGEGEMLMPPVEEEPANELADEYIVPLLPMSAYAGRLQVWAEPGAVLRDCEKVVSPVPGVDFAIRITGNSMEPEFHSGSIVFIKRINEQAFIPWGNPMVIDSENGVLIKVVYPVESRDKLASKDSYDTGHIEARSYNPAFPPIIIPTSCIYGMYRVVTSIRQYTTV